MKNNDAFNFIIFFLLFFSACNQNKVEKETPHITVDDSLSDYFVLSNDLSLSKLKRQEYASKAFEIVINQEEDSINRVNLFKVANRYYNINDWKNFKKTVELVLNNSVGAKDTFHITKAYSYLGDYYDFKLVSDSAFMFYYKAEKMYINLRIILF